MCHVVGLTRDGRKLKFAVSMRDMAMADMVPISFIEEQGLWSPKGKLTGDMTDG
jgi:hypothetical protein